MSRIDELIEELCPDGVEFRGLGRLVRFRRGNQLKTDQRKPGKYPVVTAGRSQNGTHCTWNYPANSLTVTSHGAYAGHVNYWESPIYLSNNVFLLNLDLDLISSRFLFFVLKSREQHLNEQAQGGGVPYINASDLSNIRIPVPPLEVQREIVRVLDKFTQLEAELEAELEARRRQFTFYRDSLVLSAKGPRVPMGELGTFVRGRRFTRNDVVESGIPSIHYGEIYTHYGVSAEHAVREVRSDMFAQLRFAQPQDVIFAGVGETVEDVGKAVAWMGDGPVAVHDDTFSFTSNVNSKYVAYAVQTDDFHAQKAGFVARGKVKRLSSAGLAQIAIPVPDIDQQARVVSVLDKFDALMNDLSIGLPAELAARRKQYEHYRDRLLTFKEATA